MSPPSDASLSRRSLLLGALASCTGCGGGPETVSRDCSRPVAFEGLRVDGPADALPVADTPRVPMSSTRAAHLDEVLRKLLDTVGMPAISAAMACEAGEWQATAGLARAEPAAAVTPSTVFYWASVGKALTAVLVLQLAEAGQLRLHDTLDRWFPQIAEASRITLEALLTHTSGLATNTTLPPLGTAYEPPEVLLAAALAAPSPYCPGANFSYSNIGYLLLGRVAERVAGQSYHLLVQQRIAQPLGLASLRALAPGEVAADVAVPHLQRAPRPDAGMSSRLGMGNVVARAEDILGFWRGLMSGRLLRADTLRRQWSMLSGPRDGAGLLFGQGVMQIDWTDWAGRPRTWWGHLGGTEHANAMVAYDPRLRAFLAVAVNSEASCTAVAHRLVKAMEEGAG